MPPPARLYPALAGVVILGLLLTGSNDPAKNLCRIARYPRSLGEQCLALPHLSLVAGLAAIALMALSLHLILNWQRGQPRALSYDSDAERWIRMGWILAIGGAASLLIGLVLIGSGGWPFSQQSRHIHTQTGQLPLRITNVQRRYFANYSAARPEPDCSQRICASFGDVAITNVSGHRRMALDLALTVTPRTAGDDRPAASLPGRDDLSAIARRGMTPQSLFNNPVELDPRQSLRKELVFVLRFDIDAHGRREQRIDHHYAFALQVKDRLTGQTVSMPLPAEYRG